MTKVLVFSSCTPKDNHTHPTLEVTDLMNRRTKASKTSRYLLWISAPKCWGTELATTAKLLLMETKSQSYQRRRWRGPSRRQRRRRRRRWWWRRWHRHPFRFLAPRSYQKYNQSLCPWGEGREEKEKWGKKKKRRNVFIHCKLKISQISSSQQTEDFYTVLLPKLQNEQPHYSSLMTTFI